MPREETRSFESWKSEGRKRSCGVRVVDASVAESEEEVEVKFKKSNSSKNGRLVKMVVG